MSSNTVIVDDYFVKHPPLFTIENVANVEVSRAIFLEKNTSTLPVSSDAKFIAALLNNGKYEKLINEVYSKHNIKLLEGNQENGNFELQSRGTVLQEVLACDGYNPNKSPKKRFSEGTEFNAQKVLEETAFLQARVWMGNKYGLRSSMTRGVMRHLHHALPRGLNLDRFFAIFFEVGPEEVAKKARPYRLDGHSPFVSYAQAINIIYNNYTTDTGKYKTISKAHSAYVKYNFLPRRKDGRRKNDDD